MAGSVNRAQLAELLAGTDDEELKAHYRELLGESEEGQASAPAEPEAAPEVEPELEPEPGRPADTAVKADWVAWAVYKGADEADASAATKAELIELYGGEA